MSRLLHEPTIRLRSLSQERGHASLELVRELFGLRDDEPADDAIRPRIEIGSRPPGWPRSTTSSAAARAEDPVRDARPPLRSGEVLMRIGTRGSALALAQAGHVAELLGAHPPAVGDEDPIELVTITTCG